MGTKETREYQEMKSRQEKGNAYSQRICEAAAEKYHTNPIFHNRVLLAVDVVRTTKGRDLTEAEIVVAKASACVALYLKEEDATETVFHLLSRTTESQTVCNTLGFVSPDVSDVTCPDCQRMVK